MTFRSLHEMQAINPQLIIHGSYDLFIFVKCEQLFTDMYIIYTFNIIIVFSLLSSHL